jgi:hypothetical protein
MINDGFLQHMRVGGGAGLGVKYLSRADSHVVGMVGSGGMARTYLDAFCSVRKITRLQAFSPNSGNLRAYLAEMERKHGLEVVEASSARDAVKGADIVSICTSSNEPVFLNAWLEPGQHVTNLTSADIEPSLWKAVDVSMRAGEATPRLASISEKTFYARAGFLSYVAGTAEERESVPHMNLPRELIELPTLAEFISARRKGGLSGADEFLFERRSDRGTVRSCGRGVYERARERKLGHEIPTDWFLQDTRD